ncbi:UDP-4-amino-4,6-dideoxy-N-acetyl-beta-L-altrosamine N-acetyltransferase [Psychrobacillus sp. NPDC096389]|uniref:UDP-4-amino-4, 6-dideoxy-N-acetyl-beta-L-altrosamine N-acetyltransferase n=1 Tax=Psychrobacillus sp. NPDC096389 TaxID=3364490 RepID=UPI003801F089
MNIENGAMLKNIEFEDLSLVLKWRNQQHIRNVMFNSNIISMKQHRVWFKSLENNKTAISKMFYFNDIPYGILNINQINLEHNTCEWGFYIGEVSAPSGIGIVLGYTALNFIFKELNIRKVNAEVLENNPKSRAFHEKLGFKHDGTLRKHIFKDREYLDIDVYSQFNTEWISHSQRIEQKIKEWYL